MYLFIWLLKVKWVNLAYYSKTSLNFPTKIVVLATFFCKKMRF
ncbi:hypothetical protein [Moraxella lacunata]